MNFGNLAISRRHVLQGFALAAASSLTRGLWAEELAVTPRLTEGPFYPDKLPLDTDNDLIIVNEAITPALGEVTHLTGRILSPAGEPMRNAFVEIWQVDAGGVYLNTHERHADRDANFQGFGRFLTGSTGEYYFRTIKPIAYPGRTPHIHFGISQNGRRIYTTQLFINGHAQNDDDGVLRDIRDAGRPQSGLMVDFNPLPDSRIGELAANFDIVMGVTPQDAGSGVIKGGIGHAEGFGPGGPPGRRGQAHAKIESACGLGTFLGGVQRFVGKSVPDCRAIALVEVGERCANLGLESAQLRAARERQRRAERFPGLVGLVAAYVDNGLELQHSDARRSVEQALFFAQSACRLDIFFGCGKFGRVGLAAGLALVDSANCSWRRAYAGRSVREDLYQASADALPGPGHNTRPHGDMRAATCRPWRCRRANRTGSCWLGDCRAERGRFAPPGDIERSPLDIARRPPAHRPDCRRPRPVAIRVRPAAAGKPSRHLWHTRWLDDGRRRQPKACSIE